MPLLLSVGLTKVQNWALSIDEALQRYAPVNIDTWSMRMDAGNAGRLQYLALSLSQIEYNLGSRGLTRVEFAGCASLFGTEKLAVRSFKV